MPPAVGVVEDHDLIVARSGARRIRSPRRFERGGEGDQAVFGNAGPVEPAMREARWPGI